MCLLAFHWQPDADLCLQVWANRDEFLSRPAAPTAFWDAHPQVLAGRDLQGGGSWLGVTRQGRFAALTNYRDPRLRPGTRTRGELVGDFLTGRQSAADMARAVAERGGDYGGFNLLLGDADSLWIIGHDQPPLAVSPGWHGLSNARLDTPWPKLSRLVSRTRQLDRPDPDQALALLADTAPAEDDMLPDTGVGLDMERLLSPVCIRTPAYGTRNSTWLRIGREQICWDEDDHNIGRRLSFRFAREPD